MRWTHTLCSTPPVHTVYSHLCPRAQAIGCLRSLLRTGAAGVAAACEGALAAAAAEQPSAAECAAAVGVLHALGARADVYRRGAVGVAAGGGVVPVVVIDEVTVGHFCRTPLDDAELRLVPRDGDPSLGLCSHPPFTALCSHLCAHRLFSAHTAVSLPHEMAGDLSLALPAAAPLPSARALLEGIDAILRRHLPVARRYILDDASLRHSLAHAFCCHLCSQRAGVGAAAAPCSHASLLLAALAMQV